MLALSTCWNSSRHMDGEKMLEEIVEMGFDSVELGHGTRLTLVEGIVRAHKRKLVRIVSLHNFCPLPSGVIHAAPNYYVFSSARSGERLSAIRQTRQTIDFAEQLEAQAVVLHLGHVPMPFHTEKLVELYHQHKKYSKEYVTLKLKAVREREKKSSQAWKYMLDTLGPIVEYADSKNIILGVETRYLYEEIPTERELMGLLQHFDGSTLRYWHDTGHAQSKHFLGFIDHEDALKRLLPSLAGWHIHDVNRPDHDHRAPGTGDLDFTWLKPYLRAPAIRVLELSPRLKKEEVIQSKEFLDKLLKSDDHQLDLKL